MIISSPKPPASRRALQKCMPIQGKEKEKSGSFYFLVSYKMLLPSDE